MMSVAAQISGPPAVPEGGQYTLNLAAFGSDASLVNGWTIDWGHTTEAISGNPSSVSHTFPAGFKGHAVAARATTSSGLTSEWANVGLDRAFGAAGIVTTDYADTDRLADIAYQSDGKIVAVGDSDQDFAVLRYNSNGTLDATFGNGGKVRTDFLSSADNATAVAIQPDGKIVVAGYTNAGGTAAAAVARYLSNGTLDLSFDGDGRVSTNAVGGATDVALAADGSILASASAVGGASFAVARFTPGGVLDVNFGSGGTGVATYDFPESTSARANGIVVQDDGAAVLVGEVYRSTSGYDFGLLRITPEGWEDWTFGNSGRVTTDFGAEASPFTDIAYDLVVEPSGNLVAAGYTTDPALGYAQIAVARYRPDGMPDTSFGTGGRTRAGSGIANSLARQSDGKYVVAGGSAFVNARILPDGSKDPTFGTGGQMRPLGFTSNSASRAILVQPDGKIVAAGYSGYPRTSRFALARLQPDNEVRVHTTAPSNLVANGVSYGRVDLTWQDNSGTEDATEIQRRRGTAGAWETIGYAPEASASYTDAIGLEPGTAYEYRIRAFNTADFSAFSNSDPASTTSGGAAPAVPTELMVQFASGSEVFLDWAGGIGGSIAGFNVYVGGFPDFLVEPGSLVASGLTASDFWDTEVYDSSTYYYKVTAVDAAGVSSAPTAAVAATTTADVPDAPTALTVAPPASGSVVVSWRDNSHNEDGFTILRSTDGGAEEVVGTAGSNATSSRLPEPVFGTSHAYRVVSQNAVGDSAAAGPVTIGAVSPASLPETDHLVAFYGAGEGIKDPDDEPDIWGNNRFKELTLELGGTHKGESRRSATVEDPEGSPYRWLDMSRAIRDLLSKLDRNGDRIIDAGDAANGDVRVMGWSMGAIVATELTRKIGKTGDVLGGRFEPFYHPKSPFHQIARRPNDGYEIRAAVPVALLYAIDPVVDVPVIGSLLVPNPLRRTAGPMSNVNRFVNTYQRKADGGTLLREPSTVQVYVELGFGRQHIGEETFNYSFPGSALSSSAGVSVQRNVNLDQAYRNHVVYRPYTTQDERAGDSSDNLYYGELRGYNVNHSTIVWYVYDDVIYAMENS